MVVPVTMDKPAVYLICGPVLLPCGMLFALIAFAATGAVAGLLAGLLGIGGGMVIVPALVFLLPAFGVAPSVLTQVAVGTSLACISVISINSTRAHHARDAVDWPVFVRLVPGLIAGALIGATLAHAIPSLALQRLIGVAALLVAARMAFGGNPAPNREVPGTVGLSATGGAIGTLSSLLGIGGGSLTVPFLAWCNVPMVRAVATSAACGMPIAWAGVIGFLLTGWDEPGRGAAAVGYVHITAVVGVVAGSLLLTPVGARLAHRVPAAALKRVFAVLLLIVGLRMIAG